MFFGICGGLSHGHSTFAIAPTYIFTGICAGKKSIADFLIQEYGFKRVRLLRQTGIVDQDKGDEASASSLSFENVDQMLHHVTHRWQEHWVTTDIWDESMLDKLLMRPFFLLVSVDAPVLVRWERWKERSVRQPRTLPSDSTR